MFGLTGSTAIAVISPPTGPRSLHGPLPGAAGAGAGLIVGAAGPVCANAPAVSDPARSTEAAVKTASAPQRLPSSRRIQPTIAPPSTAATTDQMAATSFL